MTTVVSPASSPTPVYNRSGITIVSVAAGTTTNNPPVGNDGAVIPAYSGWTVALLSPPAGWNQSDQLAVTLPADRDIGDIVEVYSVAGFYTGTNPARGINLLPPVGESINQLAISTGTNSTASGASVNPDHGKFFRKVSATNWQGPLE